MFVTTIWSVLIVLVVLQILCCGPILRLILNRLFRSYVVISFRGLGFIVPFLYFHARDLRILAPGSDKRDRIYFESKHIRLRLEPIFLLLGRLRIMHLRLDHPILDYTTRQESHEKNKILPGRHRVELKNAELQSGQVFIQDETMAQIYKIAILDIQLHNCDMDISTSADLFFRTRRGSAVIGSGKVEIGGTAGKGYIRVRGVSWGDILGMGDTRFLRGGVALEVEHQGGARGREVRGVVASLPASSVGDQFVRIDELGTRIPFEFEIDWDDFILTFDLGLQRLIQYILNNGKATGISSGLLTGIRGVFELIRKQER